MFIVIFDNNRLLIDPRNPICNTHTNGWRERRCRIGGGIRARDVVGARQRHIAEHVRDTERCQVQFQTRRTDVPQRFVALFNAL